MSKREKRKLNSEREQELTEGATPMYKPRIVNETKIVSGIHELLFELLP
jgi:hypothetical protein